jgi:hypothetical protein
MRPGALVGLAAGLVLGAGCGLADYERRFEQQQARLKALDEENKYLGDPVEIPSGTDNDPPVEVFWRPPKGISRSSDDKSFGDLAHYPRAGAGGGVAEVYLAVRTGDRSFLTEGIKPLVSGPLETKRVSKPIPGREPLPFYALEHDARNGYHYLIYVYQKDKAQVAVVFVVKTGDKDQAAVTTPIDYSLKSLVVGPDAARLRRAFQSRPPAKGPAAGTPRR